MSASKLVEQPFAYSWEPPKYHDGQWVDFYLRRGVIRRGMIGRVETSYNDDGTAHHTYAIRRKCKSIRWTWNYVGLDDIIGLAPAPDDET